MTDLEHTVIQAQAGDQDARERALRESRPILYDVAHGFQDVNQWGADELASFGVEGLMNALDTWDSTRSGRCWYWYAYRGIQQSVRYYRLYYRRHKRALPDTRLDVPLTPPGEDGSRTLGDTIPDYRCPYSIYARREDSTRLMHAVLHALSPRDRVIVSLYYGLGSDTRTMRQIAWLFSVSAETIRQRLKRARRKLQEHLQEPT